MLSLDSNATIQTEYLAYSMIGSGAGWMSLPAIDAMSALMIGRGYNTDIKQIHLHYTFQQTLGNENNGNDNDNDDSEKMSVKDLLKKTHLFNVLLCFALVCFILLVYDELFPLFCAGEKQYGGLGLDSQHIGYVLGI